MKRLKNKPLGAAIIALAALGASLLPSQLQAQTMDLSQCIDYALTHNNSIEQRRITMETQRVSVSSAKSSRLPSVSASLDQGWGFGRSTGRDGSTVDNTSASTSFMVGASVPLFTGFRIPNQIKAEQFSLKAATENLEQARRDASLQVATYYLNALYYKGLVSVQQRQLELDKTNLANARMLYEEGKKPESEVATAEAQVAVTEHSLSEAIGNESLARLDLMQLMNLDGDLQQFAIVELKDSVNDTALTDADLVFDNAVENYPSILAAKYNLENSKYQLKATRSGYIPTLSFSARYNTSYYYMYNADNLKFGKQLDLNGSEYLGLSLQIPIFDAFTTRNNMRKARLSIASQNTALMEARLSLNKEIQQAYWNAVKARDNYRSAQKANVSTSLAYQYEADRYASGKGTSYDLQQARTKMEKSQQDELQGRYEYIMRVKILDYYNGKELN